jgi:hypothetical protein
MPDDDQRYLPADTTFKRLVVGATGLALAFVVGSAASLERTGPEEVRFAWHWSILPWSLGAGFCVWPFWRLVWSLQERPTRKGKLRLGLYCALLLIIGLAAFLYPSRFGSAVYRSDAFRGLALAGAFLAAGAGLLFALSRALARADARADSQLDAPADTSAGQANSRKPSGH